jgi:putative nucleotidyltransferase with HDIG domain
MKDIRSEIENINDIVPFPAIVSQIMAELSKKDTAVEKIVQLIETDAVLTARILHAANSSYYGIRWTIVNINHAIMLLGFEEVSRLVLMYQMKENVVSLNPNQRTYLQNLWKHSVAVAATVRLLAQYCNVRNSGEEFTAGLLHDIGKIVIAQYFPDTLTVTQQMINDLAMNDVEAELQILAIDHAEIGAQLAERWKLPAMFVEVIRCHHNLGTTDESLTLAALVRFADLLCERWGFGINEQRSTFVLEEEESWKTLQIIFPHLASEKAENIEKEIRALYEKSNEFVVMFS